VLYLVLTSCIWGLSFGLIGNQLAGLDPAMIALVRLSLSLLVFLPFACRGAPRFGLAVGLLLLGAVQFGLMYILYIASFNHLPSHAVALFTVLTPVHVALLAGLREGRLATRPLLGALVAVAGAVAAHWRLAEASRLWLGFLLVQGSNICFAAGQLQYRRLMQSHATLSNHQAMTWMYAGSVMVCLPFAVLGYRAHGFAPTRGQIVILGYLGILASGIGFWLWNIGARRVARTGTLAVMNNAKIPIGMALSLLLFREDVDRWRLLAASAAMVTAVILCEWPARPRAGHPTA
jgi:drug/metabolite transporter (DMT)-like permease